MEACSSVSELIDFISSLDSYNGTKSGQNEIFTFYKNPAMQHFACAYEMTDG